MNFRFPALCGLIFHLSAAEIPLPEPPAERVQVTLRGGGAVSGLPLKETSEFLWIDVGYEVFRLPRAHVLGVAVELDEPAAPPAMVGGELYHMRADRPLRPVDQWVQQLGEGVVEIRSRAGQGSGFLLNDRGHVLTNHHVIALDRELTVTVFSGSGANLERIQYRNIRILAMDPLNDLALLQIDDELIRPLVWLPLADSLELRTGETVFAIGSPLGLDRTVSQGIVSLTERLINGVLFLQTTTQINPGNSGGPLLNLQGEVVGVNTLKLMRAGIEGVGFAVPSETIRRFLARRSAFAFDPRNPNAGYHYLNPPRKRESTPTP